MSQSPSSNRQEPSPSSSSQSRESNGTVEFDDAEKAIVTIARLIEQLHAKKSSPQEKELSTARLLGLARGKNEARKIIGSYAQAMPLFVSLLRSGTPLAKLNVASILSVLCKDENLRSKVLIGGCIAPLLSLLKSESTDARQAAAEAIYEVSSCGLSDDNFGTKIFVTEGVVPTLWDQLNPKKKQDKVVEGFVIGALRNLCGDKDGFWRVTLEGGGVDIILGLLCSNNPVSQSNAASLLARLVRAFSDSIPKLMDSGAVKALLQLLDKSTYIAVRSSAADALGAISSRSTEAKKIIRDLDGIHVLISAIVAPSKESVQGENGQALQEHATRALANVCGGMSALIVYLGELSKSPRLAEPVADIVGALAYALMIFEQSSGDNEESFDPTQIERILVKLLKPRDTKLIQERILEAMAGLYSNIYLSKQLNNAETKRVLVGLTTLAASDVRERLINCLSRLCRNDAGIWEAIGKREGIQIPISFLGLSSEQHQEYAVAYLAILTEQVDESRWAVTSAGGIPTLVQLLENGISQKAREDAICVLWNLCCHSEEIRACVERSGAISAFLWLLKNGGQKSQEASAKILVKLVRTADPAVVDQLLALLLGDVPKSKVHVTRVLGHVLMAASLEDLAQKGSAANNGLRYLVQALASSNEKTKELVASVLADLFSSRQDLCDTLGINEIVNPCTKLLTGNVHNVATQLARALGNLSRPAKKRIPIKKPSVAEGEVKPLIKSAKTSPIESTENPVSALVNLLSDPNIAAEALTEDVVSALTRVLREGTLQGKKNASQALHQLLKHFQVGDVFKGNDQCHFAVPALVDLLNATDVNNTAFADLLEVISLLAKAKHSGNLSHPPFFSFAEVPSSLESFVRCLADGQPSVQDKAIEILSRLCSVQPVQLGELLVARSKSVGSLANRILNSSSLEVRVGGAALLICAATNHKKLLVDTLDRSGYVKSLVCALVDMTKQNSRYSSYGIEFQKPRGFMGKKVTRNKSELDISDPATLLGGTVALWLQSIICSSLPKNRLTVMDSGGLEAISEKLFRYSSTLQAEYGDTEGIWITTLFLAIMLQDAANFVSSPTIMRIVPSLALLLKSDEMIDRYFTAQALASLVRNKNKGISLAIGNSGAVSGLIHSLGYSESDMPNLVALTEEFSLVQKPCQVVLEHLFNIEEIRLGPTVRKYIPLLVDLLKPIADRPAAPQLAVQFLTRIADDSDTNKLAMAEAGALDALAKYLSLSPQDSTEFTISELLRILFSNPKLIRHEAALSSMKQLTAVLHLGSRSARCSAARALCELFNSEKIRDSELAWKAFEPLVQMLNTAFDNEKEAALAALIKLTSGNTSKTNFLTDLEGNPLDNVYKILSSDGSPIESKISAAKLCYGIFGNKNLRTSSFSSACIEPLISLIRSDINVAVEAGVTAFERLLDDEKMLEFAAEYDVISLLVGLISGTNHRIIEASISALVKFGKDRNARKLEMVKTGLIDKCLEQLSEAPSSLCSAIAEIFRILTNSGVIARSPDATKMVEPLFAVLCKSDLTLRSQHSALQALVNVLEKPQNFAALTLTVARVITPLIPLLESPSLAIQQLSTELLTHLLSEEHFKVEITTLNSVVPLVQLAGIGITNLQEIAIKALEKISTTWPKDVADAGGIFGLSKVIVAEDPQLPLPLWESAAFVLCNILRSNPEYYYFEVPLAVLVKLLFSSIESTVMLALNALTIHEKNDPSRVVQMAEAGAIDALLDLLKSHHCEEPSGRLLEAILNNPRVQEMKICKFAMTPLSEYILDPQTSSESCRLLAALALGDLSRHEGLARVSDSAVACRALISLLEDQPSEEMKMVAICALQNFVMHSRTNRRAVAEAGGVWLIQELLMSCNAEVAGQAALMIKSLFSNHTLQEYVSNELIRSLTAAIERELWETATTKEEVVRTLNIIFTNFPKLRSSEATTLCIPHLIGALKSGSEDAQESVLDTLYLLRHSWPNMQIDIATSQSLLAAEVIPVLQMLMKERPSSFHERADSLLYCLPGCLTVNVKRGNSLKKSMGNTNAFCRLMIGNCPPKQTKVVSRSTSPEWKEGFTWDFAVPPRGQTLLIVCKSKNIFRKTTLGKVAIQIDKVLTEGVHRGLFSLSHKNNRDGSYRTLEIEITWSNQISNHSI